MYRIGHSLDVHPLVKGRQLFIGGVKIPHHLGLDGHSDADVLLHAVAESIIGALGLGDLGKHFPSSDLKYKDIDSKLLLKHVYELMDNEGYEINNLDCNVILELPKLAPYIHVINQTIADILNTNIKNVNTKAGTMEKLGFVGNEEGIVATCTVLLRKKK